MEQSFDNAFYTSQQVSTEIATEAYTWTDAYDYGRVFKASGEAVGLVGGTETLDDLGFWELVITAAPIIPGKLGRYVDKAGEIKSIRNFDLAGKIHPETGVPFNKNGFPDFSNHLYTGGNNTVTIKPTGDRKLDRITANIVAGYDSTPEGYIWHHTEETGVMQLVNQKVHQNTGHTGGFALWK